MSAEGSKAWVRFILGSTQEPLNPWREAIRGAGVKMESGLEQARCVSEVLRPSQGEAPQASAENRVGCELSKKDGTKSAAVLSFGEIPISAWGNIADRLPFQVYGPLAEGLLKDLVQWRRLNAEDPMYSSFEICGPGMLCNESYFINSAPEPSDKPATLACSRDSELTSEAIDALRRGENPLPPSRGGTFHDEMNEQIEAGVRTVTDTRCVWINAVD